MDKPDDNKTMPAQDETRIVLGFDDLEIEGETVKVNEFTFVQELKALTIAEPIIKAIANLYSSDDEPDMSTIERVFAEHGAAMIKLLSLSLNKPVEWFESLPGKYTNGLFLTFWGVNSHFFTQRIASQYIMAHPGIIEASKKLLDLEKSSQH